MKSDERFVKIYAHGKIEGSQILVDTETGVNYYFRFSGYAGGLTPLLDENGKPVVTSKDELKRWKEKE